MKFIERGFLRPTQGNEIKKPTKLRGQQGRIGRNELIGTAILVGALALFGPDYCNNQKVDNVDKKVTGLTGKSDLQATAVATKIAGIATATTLDLNAMRAKTDGHEKQLADLNGSIVAQNTVNEEQDKKNSRQDQAILDIKKDADAHEKADATAIAGLKAKDQAQDKAIADLKAKPAPTPTPTVEPTPTTRHFDKDGNEIGPDGKIIKFAPTPTPSPRPSATPSIGPENASSEACWIKNEVNVPDANSTTIDRVVEPNQIVAISGGPMVIPYIDENGNRARLSFTGSSDRVTLAFFLGNAQQARTVHVEGLVPLYNWVGTCTASDGNPGNQTNLNTLITAKVTETMTQSSSVVGGARVVDVVVIDGNNRLLSNTAMLNK